jgi:sigma-B regulation protein RsbU (phosphoserine phosphatase)
MLESGPMARPFAMEAPPAPVGPAFPRRLRTFLLERWLGRILLVALVVAALGMVGLQIPVLTTIARLVVWIYAIVGCLRLVAFALRRVLWRIRTKLLLSYLFIALVPVVLLTLFFFIASILLLNLMAAHLVTAEIDRIGQTLLAEARTSLGGLPVGDPVPALKERLRTLAERHPGLAWSFFERGRALATSGGAPDSLPDWWKGPSFSSIVPVGESEHLRSAWMEGTRTLVLEVPVDGALFDDLESRMGIHLLSAGGKLTKVADTKGLRIEIDDEVRPPFVAEGKRSGVAFVATPERVDWKTGEREFDALTFQFRPWELVRRLQPGSLNMADMLVVALAAVGGVFLVMYAVALFLGLFLARSITGSVHALSIGTKRLRAGDFGQTIAVSSRDQLGELAESFNLMSRGIRGLMREQAEKDRLEEELRIAREIQMSLLPAQGTVTPPGLRVAALCLPAAEVGGDYYDLLPLSETKMGLLVADVSGKGTSAALYMAELKGLVLSLSRIYDSPKHLLAEANRILSANMDSRSFVTMTYAVVDTEKRTLRHARAGHNPILHFEARTGKTHVLAPPGLGLGIDRGPRFEQVLEEVETPLASGDLFLFFTDGLSEAMNMESELFGEGRLRRILEQGAGIPGEELKERILAEIRAFVGEAAQHDDMTLVLLKVV